MDEPFHGIVEVNYNPVKEIWKGLHTYRNKFCDVRLWVENHAIPAHKLVLSLHSSFFQQMFKSETDTPSEVFLNDVRYNVVYPIIEFMYTGRAYIDSTVVFDEIKEFSRNINFHPFETLWANGPGSTVSAFPDQTSDAYRPPMQPTYSSSTAPVDANPNALNNVATTHATTCPSLPQESHSFAPASASTPVTMNSVSMAHKQSIASAMIMHPRVDESQPKTPLRANLESRSFVIPPAATKSTSLSPPKFFGFSPADMKQPKTHGQTIQHSNGQTIQQWQSPDKAFSVQATTYYDRNTAPPVIELSEMSPDSPTKVCSSSVIEIDEMDGDSVSPMAENISSVIEIIPEKVKGKPRAAAKSRAPRKLRAKKGEDTPDDIYVSAPSLFKNLNGVASQRGRKRKN